MTFDQDELEKIKGDNIESIDFIMYDVEKEFPFIHGASSEHLKICLACAQRAMRHHSGIGNPLDEDGIKVGVAYISQISERASIILEQTQKILIEHEKQIRELNNTVGKVVALVAENSKSNNQVLTELKDTIKKDLTRFYKIVVIVSVPLIIGSGFILSWISKGG